MAIEMKVPAVGESITEVTLAQWLKADGEYVEMDEVIAELESEKATFELNAEKSGTLKHLANAGDTLAIGAAIASIDETAAAPADKKSKPEKAATPSPAPVIKSEPAPQPAPVSDEKPNATPLAAKILAEKGIDPKQVAGSGPQGRILKADALAAVLNPLSNLQKSRNIRSDKMTTLRKTVARRLVAAKNETAMLTTFNEVDMKPIMDLRARYKDKFKETHGVGLGFMSFFIKAVTIALQEFPAINSYVEGENIEYHDYCDIGIAVSAPKGLMVPVIRNAEALTMAEIESEVIRLATRARDNKISLEEMSGGTFTITNGGVFGSMLSTPILNPPQSAILGMHNIVERPVVVGGQIVIRPIMYVALSYDHRIVDGRESVSFLVKVKQGLEDPIRLLSGGKDPGALLLGI